MSDDLLGQEYVQLQTAWREMGARMITIKAWSVTFSAAGLGLGFSQEETVLFLVAAFSAVVFWTVEGVVKVHQRAFVGRIDQIETHFGGGAETKPFQILAARERYFASTNPFLRVARMMIYTHVMLPHIVIIAAGLALYFLPIGFGEADAAAVTPPPSATPR